MSRDHPDLVRRPVLHASAYTLGDAAKELQMGVGYLARYEGEGHAPAGKQVGQDILAFLRQDMPEEA